jgi:glycine betaine/proline transport system ATP-binding protein
VSEIALEARNLYKVFGKNPNNAVRRLKAGESRADVTDSGTAAVIDASFTVNRGEIFVIMGLSGSGKSTIIRMLNGLHDATDGSVTVSGDPITGIPASRLREIRRDRISMVFQHFALLPHRTVAANVAYPLELKGIGKAERFAKAEEILTLVGLEGQADKLPSELSGGMQQRVGLARAFATDADILLMDEPFSAHDPLIRGKLQDELLALQERVKKTILFVSHDLDEALRLGDRISILQNGRIVQTGTAEDIVLAPADDYVAEFVRHMNPLDVLTGSMIMRARASMAQEGNSLWLDERRRYRLAVGPADEALELHLDGVAHELRHVLDDAGLANVEAGLAVAPASFSLQSIIQLRQATGHPVLLSDGGKIIGVCSENEILRALAGSRP